MHPGETIDFWGIGCLSYPYENDYLRIIRILHQHHREHQQGQIVGNRSQKCKRFAQRSKLPVPIILPLKPPFPSHWGKALRYLCLHVESDSPAPEDIAMHHAKT